MAIENKTVEELVEMLREQWPKMPEAGLQNWARVWQQFGCCDKARFMQCVCMYAFKCPDHGETHVGSHD